MSEPQIAADRLRHVGGVPETAISEVLAARLPAPAPAPWTTSGSGLLWLHLSSAGAAQHHQRGLAFQHSLPVTLGAFLRYDQGPVGAYDEVLGVPTLVIERRRLRVPVAFMAVDSQSSIAGGRGNWALPKTMAQFQWESERGAPHRLNATGDGWSVTARVRWSGPRIPLWVRASLAQVDAAGTVLAVPVRSSGIGRLARIEVTSEGPTLPSWLRRGVHTGAVVEHATHTILPAIPRAASGRTP